MKMIDIQFFIISTILCFYTSIIFATEYTFSGTGNWTDAGNWSPSYPGTTISSSDGIIVPIAARRIYQTLIKE